MIACTYIIFQYEGLKERVISSNLTKLLFICKGIAMPKVNNYPLAN